ncbi:MAG TPA: Uma2 family endonuclease [Blastocatellia bacterium]|nr:Uma2 family endonuclease [Blastocatellia bacterium]
MNTTTQLMTADELLKLPRGQHRYELIRGELKTMSPAGSEHGVVIMRLAWRLAQHVEAGHLGETFGAETGFRIESNPDTVLAPDLAFVSRERIPPEGVPKGYWPGAPDLAVEVVSPGDTFTEVADKVAAWLDAGARAVWVANPKRRTITVHRSLTEAITLSAGDELDGQDVITGFRCRVSDIFA